MPGMIASRPVPHPVPRPLPAAFPATLPALLALLALALALSFGLAACGGEERILLREDGKPPPAAPPRATAGEPPLPDSVVVHLAPRARALVVEHDSRRLEHVFTLRLGDALAAAIDERFSRAFVQYGHAAPGAPPAGIDLAVWIDVDAFAVDEREGARATLVVRAEGPKAPPGYARRIEARGPSYARNADPKQPKQTAFQLSRTFRNVLDAAVREVVRDLRQTLRPAGGG